MGRNSSRCRWKESFECARQTLLISLDTRLGLRSSGNQSGGWRGFNLSYGKRAGRSSSSSIPRRTGPRCTIQEGLDGFLHLGARALTSPGRRANQSLQPNPRHVHRPRGR
ncbi:hypothetical protein KC19_VG293900 [Ceratodon purpureus]|uniref:Uncharacterized protein n=1 Tax=Ceratodon purpureus TaxID=3225 RepID=A0A8T0HV03_CERPU|nr:hypothetical protein KC19_VG293900 [Ceratodon purpureus]